jgi:hypothetical protein
MSMLQGVAPAGAVLMEESGSTEPIRYSMRETCAATVKILKNAGIRDQE